MSTKDKAQAIGQLASAMYTIIPKQSKEGRDYWWSLRRLGEFSIELRIVEWHERLVERYTVTRTLYLDEIGHWTDPIAAAKVIVEDLFYRIAESPRCPKPCEEKT